MYEWDLLVFCKQTSLKLGVIGPVNSPFTGAELHTLVGSVPNAGSIPGSVNFYPRIDDSHCDRIHSFLTAVQCFDNKWLWEISQWLGKKIVRSTGVPRGPVVKCLTCNPGVQGSSRIGSFWFFRGSVLGQDTSEPRLVLVKPRKDMNNVSCRRDMTEILLKWRKTPFSQSMNGFHAADCSST